jgi:hypothetical protein
LAACNLRLPQKLNPKTETPTVICTRPHDLSNGNNAENLKRFGSPSLQIANSTKLVLDSKPAWRLLIAPLEMW